MKKRYLTILSLSAFVCLNADTVHITLPKVVDAPEVKAVVIPAVDVVVDGKKEMQEEKRETTINKEILYSKRLPPHFNEKEQVSTKKSLVGEIYNAIVPAYLRAPLNPKDDVEAILKAAGFVILASYDVDQKARVKSIVFSDGSIASAAALDTRGFSGTLRLSVDENSKQISITNPIYMMKAFMQDDYNSEVATLTLIRLRKAFKGLVNSLDLLKKTRLEHYQFMDSMPYYEDMKEIASGSNETLLQKARKSGKVVYEQHLSNGSSIIGVTLSSRTSKFVKKIGYQNSGLLPYPILIEKNKAKILAPKYYIAVMYPMLSMSEFMGISTIPGAIVKECGKIFR